MQNFGFVLLKSTGSILNSTEQITVLTLPLVKFIHTCTCCFMNFCEPLRGHLQTNFFLSEVIVMLKAVNHLTWASIYIQRSLERLTMVVRKCHSKPFKLVWPKHCIHLPVLFVFLNTWQLHCKD